MTDTKTTLEEQIATLAALKTVIGLQWSLSEAIDSLKELAAIRSAELPVEPVESFTCGMCGLGEMITKQAYDSLQSVLQVAQQEKADAFERGDQWETTATNLLTRAEKAESELAALRGRLMDDSALQRAGAEVGTMNGYEGESPDADHFEWFKAMSAVILKEGEMNAKLVVLENDNGVQIREDFKSGDHYKAANAICYCGDELIVAPMLFHADHKKGDPVMVCGDHGVHAYRFKSLIQGKQPEMVK